MIVKYKVFNVPDVSDPYIHWLELECEDRMLRVLDGKTFTVGDLETLLNADIKPARTAAARAERSDLARQEEEEEYDARFKRSLLKFVAFYDCDQTSLFGMIYDNCSSYERYLRLLPPRGETWLDNLGCYGEFKSETLTRFMGAIVTPRADSSENANDN